MSQRPYGRYAQRDGYQDERYAAFFPLSWLMQFERLSGTITRDRCTNGMKLFVLLGEIYSLDGSPAWAMFWRAATFFSDYS